MIYVAGGLAALGLSVGLLYLVGRGAERRERAPRPRRGIKAGDGVEGGLGYAAGGDVVDGGGCDSGGGGGGGGGGCD